MTQLRHLLIVICLISYNYISPKNAVTYTFSGGRLGDNLVSYCHAKWFSYIHDIELLYKPFPYSDHLMLHEIEKPYSDLDIDKFTNIVYVTNINNITIDKEGSNLYVIPFFPESTIELNWPIYKNCVFFSVNWSDPVFLRIIRECIKPRYILPEIEIPQGYISVAVHVRNGGTLEKTEDLRKLYLLKCPSDNYYIDQIRAIADIFYDKKLYVYIFSDHGNPIELVKEFEQILNNPKIKFHCRMVGNTHNRNVLEDFFAITKFDCLVRPDSNFSIIASKLADYQVSISPGGYQDNKIIVNIATK